MRILADTNILLDYLLGRNPFNADCIVTRNVKDFALSKIPAISPEDFLEKLNVK